MGGGHMPIKQPRHGHHLAAAVHPRHGQAAWRQAAQAGQQRGAGMTVQVETRDHHQQLRAVKIGNWLGGQGKPCG